MGNDNCLEGIKCPRCGNEERLLIGCSVMADVTDEGAEVSGDMEWGDDSLTVCPVCDESGRLAEFRRGHLPPDPEGMNDSRAAWAGQALAAFIAATGTDREDAVADLLADLIHWCDRSGQDFGHELARARDHYEAETLGDESTN